MKLNDQQETALTFLDSIAGPHYVVSRPQLYGDELPRDQAEWLTTEFALKDQDVLVEFPTINFILYGDGSWTPLPRAGYPPLLDTRHQES